MIHVLSRLLAPWRTTATLRVLVHNVLGFPLAFASTMPTVGLLVGTVFLAVALPVALIPLTFCLVWTRVIITVERSRFAALHGVELPDDTAHFGLFDTDSVPATIVLGLGTFLGWGLVRTLNASEGFGTFALPVGSMVTVLLVGAMVGVLAGLRPAWRASRLDVLDAVRAV